MRTLFEPIVHNTIMIREHFVHVSYVLDGVRSVSVEEHQV